MAPPTSFKTSLIIRTVLGGIPLTSKRAITHNDNAVSSKTHNPQSKGNLSVRFQVSTYDNRHKHRMYRRIFINHLLEIGGFGLS